MGLDPMTSVLTREKWGRQGHRGAEGYMTKGGRDRSDAATAEDPRSHRKLVEVKKDSCLERTACAGAQGLERTWHVVRTANSLMRLNI